jgi:peroxiredoxin
MPTYNGKEVTLCEDFIDVGYMAENFTATDRDGNEVEIKRSHPNRSMTLLLSMPSGGFETEILRIDKFISAIEVDINCYLVLNQKVDIELKKFELIIDSLDEFGGLYGTKIEGEYLQDELTKALFLISKDGAVFYLDMPEKLEDEIKLDRLQVELNKAYVSYTGQGCH